VLLASEPTTAGDWTEIADRSILVVDEHIAVHTADLV
jgi:predicted glutamine amidotransferase